jgi:hypothetical protein
MQKKNMKEISILTEALGGLIEKLLAETSYSTIYKLTGVLILTFFFLSFK